MGFISRCYSSNRQGSELTCWIRNLPDTKIRFVVRAYNVAGESGDTEEAVYTPTSPPALTKPNRTLISAD
jgi:hypothetical protein